MSNKCPKCGSVRIAKASEDVNICLACESFLNTINGKSRSTLFDRITASPEVLAEKLVFPLADGWWMSSIIDGTRFATRERAIAATVARLKGAENE